jgi:NADPH:quinone reductase-like Zn-dependent oxidoreductase
VARAQAEIFTLARAGKLRPIVARTFPLEGFAEALALIRDGKARGKLVLSLDR